MGLNWGQYIIKLLHREYLATDATFNYILSPIKGRRI
jgi:hypothetical protein